MTPETPASCSIVLESRPSALEGICQQILSTLKAFSFSEDDVFGVHLALEEAFLNAVKHGNGMDDSKKVEVEFERNGRQFRVRVRDQGAGFDWDHTSDPRAEENISRSTGRGIFFMKHFADQVSFVRLPGRGTEVLLEKRLEPASRGGQAMRRRKG